MKFIILLITCLIPSIVYGADNQIYPITNPVSTQRYTTSQIMCIDGYKYVITQTQPEYTSSQSGFGLSVVQMLKTVDVRYPPQPVKCRE